MFSKMNFPFVDFILENKLGISPNEEDRKPILVHLKEKTSVLTTLTLFGNVKN
jgi:hypothetical protein